jgi:hypothetical protein
VKTLDNARSLTFAAPDVDDSAMAVKEPHVSASGHGRFSHRLVSKRSSCSVKIIASDVSGTAH